VKIKDFYFHLPAELIARFPAARRDQSKLMVVDRDSGAISHHVFKDVLDLIDPWDFMVINTSRVMPAKFFGEINGHPVEVLLVKNLDEYRAEALALPARRLKKGVQVIFDCELRAEVIDTGFRGRRILCFNKKFASVLKQGFAPLPPYIKRKSAEAITHKSFDLSRYQTVYSKRPGSIAAPTAGLHFSPALLRKIRKKIDVFEINLDVGEATFQKIDAEEIEAHKMGKETVTILSQTRQNIRESKKSKKLLAIGTTTVRALETLAGQKPETETFESELFITPGFRFRMVDKLITNFHLPESSLFILVSAFAGLGLMQKAYRIAIENQYRFFSYGDAMMII
jgi:S-adenosylmethionine:tRNA ribosyltransferase-isomerase